MIPAFSAGGIRNVAWRNDEIVRHEVQRDRMTVVFEFLLKPFVNRVKRRMRIRMVKFCRSM